MRPGWDETWMNVATVMGRRSGCVRAQIGAVIVDARNEVVATGYNGAPATMASQKHLGHTATCEFDCPRAMPHAQIVSSYANCISIHAEANALLFRDRRDALGGTIYTTAVPCGDCLKLIANSGLARVVCVDDGHEHRSFASAQRFLTQCGIKIDRWVLPVTLA